MVADINWFKRNLEHNQEAQIMKKSLAEIAEFVNGQIIGEPEKMICDAGPFEHANEDQITFAENAKFLKKIEETHAGAVLVPKDPEDHSKNLIVVEKPKLAFARIMSLFHAPSIPESFVSPSAHIGKNVTYGQNVNINPFVMISDNVTIGDRVVLHPHVCIGENSVIGNDVVIYPNVTVYHGTKIGNRVTIHGGTVIGSDGYGFVPDGDIYQKIPQIGFVQIDDDVELGASNTIDRATFGKTWIQKGVKTDNLVQIGHNSTVGENSIMVAQGGLAGSVTVGKHVILAGQVAVTQHLTIGDNAIVGPKAGVAKSVPAGETVSGSPEMPHKLWLRVQRIIPRLPELKKKISELEKRLFKLEEEKS